MTISSSIKEKQEANSGRPDVVAGSLFPIDYSNVHWIAVPIGTRKTDISDVAMRARRGHQRCRN
jgi:hypothetical protein